MAANEERESNARDDGRAAKVRAAFIALALVTATLPLTVPVIDPGGPPEHALFGGIVGLAGLITGRMYGPIAFVAAVLATIWYGYAFESPYPSAVTLPLMALGGAVFRSLAVNAEAKAAEKKGS